MCGTGPFPLCTLQIGYGAKGPLECEPHQECAKCRLVVKMAVVIITASEGSTRSAARDAGIRHRRQRAADTSLRRTDTEHHSIFSSAKQYHQSSQYMVNCNNLRICSFLSLCAASLRSLATSVGRPSRKTVSQKRPVTLCQSIDDTNLPWLTS
jgi:hypothetical protein